MPSATDTILTAFRGKPPWREIGLNCRGASVGISTTRVLRLPIRLTCAEIECGDTMVFIAKMGTVPVGQKSFTELEISLELS